MKTLICACDSADGRCLAAVVSETGITCVRLRDALDIARRAGWAPPRVSYRRRASPAEHEEVLDAIRAGALPSEAARRFGVNKRTIRSWMDRAGVKSEAWTEELAAQAARARAAATEARKAKP